MYSCHLLISQLSIPIPSFLPSPSLSSPLLSPVISLSIFLSYPSTHIPLFFPLLPLPLHPHLILLSSHIFKASYSSVLSLSFRTLTPSTLLVPFLSLLFSNRHRNNTQSISGPQCRVPQHGQRIHSKKKVSNNSCKKRMKRCVRRMRISKI
jgi:hypothetical protein